MTQYKMYSPKCLLFIFLILQYSFALSQSAPTQNIKGSVFDNDSRSYLQGATIIVIGSNPIIGTTSDSDGWFIINNIPVGRYNLEISFIGYKSTTLSDVLVHAGKETVLEIGMVEEVKNLDEIVISPRNNNVESANNMAVVSARSISPDETQRYAGGLNDPSRVALSYAGINNGNGDRNEVIIRGNSPKGLLWRLEGLEIPNPNHFAVEGGTGGLIGILNSSNMARSDFLISAFPSEFGNAYSGVFDLQLRKGNADKREHTAESSLLGISLASEGPISKKNKSSYIVNYRYSTLGLLKKTGIVFQAPDFQDITFKINLPTQNKGTFSIYGLGGLGKWLEQDFFRKIDSTQQVIGSNGKVIYGYDEIADSSIQQYDLGIVGISHFFPINDQAFIESSLGISGTRNQQSEVGLDKTNFSTYLAGRGNYINTSLGYSSNLNYKFNAKHLLKIGLIFSQLGFKLNAETGFPDGSTLTDLKNSGKANMIQGYSSWQYKLKSSLILNSGVHFTYFSLSRQKIIEPRFGIEQKLNDNQTLSFGVGLHSRHESIATYFGEYLDNGIVTLPNSNLSLSRAAHFVIGYTKSFSRVLNLKFETYYQYLFDVPVENNPSSNYSLINQDISFTTIPLINKGKGLNYGVEITLERSFSNQYYFIINGSAFTSEFKTINGPWMTSRYNIGHIVNIISGKEFSIGASEKFKKLGLNFRGSTTGGKRVTPIDLNSSIENGYEKRFDYKPYNEQLKSYLRVDLSIYLKRERRHSTHELKLDVLNLIERNLQEVSFTPDQLNRAGQLVPAHIQNVDYANGENSLFPVLSYNVRF